MNILILTILNYFFITKKDTLINCLNGIHPTIYENKINKKWIKTKFAFALKKSAPHYSPAIKVNQKTKKHNLKERFKIPNKKINPSHVPAKHVLGKHVTIKNILMKKRLKIGVHKNVLKYGLNLKNHKPNAALGLRLTNIKFSHPLKVPKSAYLKKNMSQELDNMVDLVTSAKRIPNSNSNNYQSEMRKAYLYKDLNKELGNLLISFGKLIEINEDMLEHSFVPNKNESILMLKNPNLDPIALLVSNKMILSNLIEKKNTENKMNQILNRIKFNSTIK
ncbi:unnamed protein product [Gordionus sp. m RMFG-2023]